MLELIGHNDNGFVQTQNLNRDSSPSVGNSAAKPTNISDQQSDYNLQKQNANKNRTNTRRPKGQKSKVFLCSYVCVYVHMFIKHKLCLCFMSNSSSG